MIAIAVKVTITVELEILTTLASQPGSGYPWLIAPNHESYHSWRLTSMADGSSTRERYQPTSTPRLFLSSPNVNAKH